LEERQIRRSRISNLSFEERLNVLYRHASQLGGAESIEEIAKHTLDAMEATIGVDTHDFFVVRGGILLRVETRGGAPMGRMWMPLDGPGITVKAVNMMRTMLVPDVREEPAYLEALAIGPGGEPLRTLSELAVPVITDGKVVAVLNTESIMLNALNEQDKELLETLARQAASAISRLRYEERLKGLHQHASQLGIAESIEQVAEYTLDAMETTLGLEICDFAILQEDRLQSILERGRDRAILSRTQAWKALHTTSSILVPDTREEPAYVDAEIIGENGVKLEILSELSVPVVADGEAVAVLSVESPRLNAFNEQDKELLETLAGHVGSAISRLARTREVRELAYRLNSLKPGGCYLSQSHERCLKAYADLTMHGVPGLCIVREDPGRLVENYGLKAEEIMLLSSRPLKGFEALPDLQAISLAVSRLLKSGGGVVLLDGLEYLITSFSFDAVFSFIKEKRFDFLEADAVLLVPIDMETLSSRERALLSSELSILE